MATQMCCGECGIEFSVPDHFYKERYQTGKGWYCPNGHSRVFKESETDKLRRERDQLKQREAMLQDEIGSRDKAIKRLKKRAAAGTCPCCQRTFQNMAAHMKKQHPQFHAEAVNVVPLKAVSK